MKRNLPHIAKALRRAREAAGFSQHLLAERSGVSRPTIAAIEMGSPRNVKSETIVKLARALSVGTSELLGWDDEHGDDYDLYITAFVRSELALPLRIDATDVEYLRALCHAWPQGRPSHASMTLLLAAIKLDRFRTRR
jgi:transcriptional regulator with XRE-family HTH domain